MAKCLLFSPLSVIIQLYIEVTRVSASGNQTLHVVIDCYKPECKQRLRTMK